MINKNSWPYSICLRRIAENIQIPYPEFPLLPISDIFYARNSFNKLSSSCASLCVSAGSSVPVLRISVTVILVSGIGACKGIILEESVIFIIPYYIISFLGLYCYFSISSFVDINGKIQMLRTNLISIIPLHAPIPETKMDKRTSWPERCFNVDTLKPWILSLLIYLSTKMEILEMPSCNWQENHLANRIEQTNLDMKLVHKVVGSISFDKK